MRYPLGIQSFSEIRTKDFVYVDKTKLVYDLACIEKYYFLGRPRRFGKSLLVSTLDAYFSGKKELFEGLAISKLEKDWKKHPVLRLDFCGGNYQNPEGLSKYLNHYLKEWETEYGSTTTVKDLGLRFENVVKNAYNKTGESVVILIDEYDKPFLDLVGHEDVEASNRKILQSFYGAIKRVDKFTRFVFFTGITKWYRDNVLSYLNINDISMNKKYASICGFTEEELHSIFDEEVEAMAQKRGITEEECYSKLKTQYFGYHFGKNAPGVYDPWSILNALSTQEFRGYWTETGSPSFLAELLRRRFKRIPNLDNVRNSYNFLLWLETFEISIIPLLYQTGYLTIKDVNKYRLATLGYPNKEVERDFTTELVPFYTGMSSYDASFYIAAFADELYDGDPTKLMKYMKKFCDKCDYRITELDQEDYFQELFTIIYYMSKQYCQADKETSDGRCDLVVQTDNFIYIIEFKYDGSAEEALKQINEKDYAKAFALNSRKLYKIGINFSSETRSINEWKIEE